MNGKLITVVVPVYKVEQYIDKCLSSLIVPEKQLPLLEVIVVNDGTPDRSAEMAREYEKRFPEVFRVIDKENGGHGSAWNRGLKEASGKFISFLDSDDWYDTAEFSRLITRLSDLDTDMVLYHYNQYLAQTDETERHLMYAEEIDRTFPIASFEWDKLSWERTNFWGCTYKTSMLQKEMPLFMEGVSYDDAILFIAPAILASSIHVFNATIYNYLIGRPGQTMAAEVRKKKRLDWIKTHFHVFRFCAEHLPLASGSPEQISYVSGFLKTWLFEAIIGIVGCPYRQSRTLAKECGKYFRILKGKLPQGAISSKFFLLLAIFPYPVFFLFIRLFIRTDPV